MIPYGRQNISDDDIDAVVGALRSEWLTTGPMVPAFEQACARMTGSKYAVAVSSGTAALHASMYAIGITPGDEVILPAMTFAATANCVVYQGGTPVFADVEPDTLLIDPSDVQSKICSRTKAIVAVDYAGQPCDYDALRDIARRNDLMLVADACHSLGGQYKGVPVGSLADLSTFSFHPVKHITTGEGGMIASDNTDLAERMRIFRNHGITSDHRERSIQGSWFYEMVDLGYNYRITDFQCALGISQLRKLVDWVERRRTIARRYDVAFSEIIGIEPLNVRPEAYHAYHLYVIRLKAEDLGCDRETLFSRLRFRGIGVNVHYIPVHLHPYYRQRFGTGPALCPQAEAAYKQIISLPMYPGMTDADVEDVIKAVHEVTR